MKKFTFLVAGLCLYLIGMAQTDTTTPKPAPRRDADTIRIGGMIIIKSGKHKTGDSTSVRVEKRRRKRSDLSTNWLVVDLGFNNYNDKTDYASAAAQQFAPGSNKEWFKLRNGKSINVNVWLFMQQLNLVKNVVNLKYGLGVELNNYRYQEKLRFTENPTTVYRDVINYTKNKLAADYVTVPFMLNINFTPRKDNIRSFGLSAGFSAGYLYGSRQKFVSGETGKQKVKDDFDLRPYKISYIAELQLGPVSLYGSMATKSMFEKGLDQTPYNLGLRFMRLSSN